MGNGKKNYKNYLKGLGTLKYVILPFDKEDGKIMDNIKNNKKQIIKNGK